MTDRFAHPALVIVDMQNDFVRVGAPLEVPESRPTIPVHQRLLAACRERGVPIVYTKFIAGPQRTPTWQFSPQCEPPVCCCWKGFKRFYKDVGKELDCSDIIDELYPERGDPIVDKFWYGAFHNTNLDDLLRARPPRRVSAGHRHRHPDLRGRDGARELQTRLPDYSDLRRDLDLRAGSAGRGAQELRAQVRLGVDGGRGDRRDFASLDPILGPHREADGVTGLRLGCGRLRHPACVGSEQHRRRPPAALLLDVEERGVEREHRAGERVTELLSAPVAHAGHEQHALPRSGDLRRGQRLPVPLEHERLRVERPHREPAKAVKDAPSGVRGPWAPLRGVVRRRVQDRDGAGLPCLRRPQPLARPRPPDRHRTGLDVEVLPLEPGDLAGPGAGLGP
jgi:hypothetical protein